MRSVVENTHDPVIIEHQQRQINNIEKIHAEIQALNVYGNLNPTFQLKAVQLEEAHVREAAALLDARQREEEVRRVEQKVPIYGRCLYMEEARRVEQKVHHPLITLSLPSHCPLITLSLPICM